MLTQEQCHALKPLLAAIQDSHAASAEAEESFNQITARLAALESEHAEHTEALGEAEAAHRKAVALDNAASSERWERLQAIRREAEEKEAELGTVRDLAREAERRVVSAAAAVTAATNEFLLALHAEFVEGFNAQVAAFYENIVAPVWYVEHCARSQPKTDWPWLDRLGPGVRDFYVKYPVIRNIGPDGKRAMLGDRQNFAAIRFGRAPKGPGIDPGRAEGFVQACIAEIQAA